MIFSGRSKLVFAPPVSHTELSVVGFRSWLRKTDGADVLPQLEGRAHEQQGEVVVVVTGVKVRVFLEIKKNEWGPSGVQNLTWILLTFLSW